MPSRRLGTTALLFVLVIGVATVVLVPLTQHEAAAQLAPAQPPGVVGGPGRLPGEPGAPGMVMPPRFQPPAPPTPAIAVWKDFVFVVQDGTIYKFDANTLDLIAQTTFIERPEPPVLQPFTPGGPPAPPRPPPG